MMEARELRIGNLVNKGNNPIVVKDICDIGINSEIYSYGHCDQIYHTLFKEIEPIPLTEEWPLRFGFLKVESSANPLQDVYRKGNITIRKRMFNGWIWAVTFYGLGDIDIEYVHQLQNLYFALTGNEPVFK